MEVDFEEVDVVVLEDGEDVADLEVGVVAMAEEEVSGEAVVVDRIDSGMFICLLACRCVERERRDYRKEVQRERKAGRKEWRKGYGVPNVSKMLACLAKYGCDIQYSSQVT